MLEPRLLLDGAGFGAAGIDLLPAAAVANAAPVLQLPDQVMPHTQDRLQVTLPRADADGDVLRYAVSIRDAQTVAGELRQRLGLATYAPEWDNYLNRGDKWLQDRAGAWYVLLPNGELNKGRDQLQGTVHTSYYADPQLLLSAQQVAAPAVTATVVRNVLTVDPAEGYVGAFEVQVTADDGRVTTTDAFYTTVTNTAPELSLADQTIPHTQDQLQVALPRTDADGEVLSHAVSVRDAQVVAYELRQRLGLTTYAPQWDNFLNRGDKWLQDGTGAWYVLLPNGELNKGRDQLQGRLHTSYYADPRLLLNAQQAAAPGVTATVVGNVLTIDPADGFVGALQVEVTAGDGVATTTGTFFVAVTNTAPSLDLPDHTIPPTQDRLQVALPRVDADGDVLRYGVSVRDARTVAWQLRQRLGLTTYAPQWDNYLNRGDKWLQDGTGAWYVLLPNGELNKGRDQLQGTVHTSYYTNPQLLLNAQEALAPAVTTTVTGNVLTIDPAAGFTRAFQVEVTANDGAATASGAFYVTVRAAGDVFEDDDTSYQATEIATDGTAQTHSIHVGTDVDWVTFTLAQRSDVTIETNGSRGDTRMWLYGPGSSTTQIAYDDDGGPGLFSRIVRSGTAALEAGTYHVKVDEYGNNNQIDSYTISVTATAVTQPQPQPQPGGFDIQLTFSGLTQSQQQVFEQAAQQWERMIVGDLPDMNYNGQLVDDLLIDASARAIDGQGSILGQATATNFRSGSRLPCRGFMQFDSADIAAMEASGEIIEVVMHEMAHVLGFGVIWQDLGLLSGTSGSDPRFTGARATAEYNAIFGASQSGVPVEAGGGAGTALSHWRESTFGAELMTGWHNSGRDNPISRVTLASMADLGYQVNMSAAETYIPG